MSSTMASISDKTELWWRESQDLVAPFASAIAEATQNAWRDGHKHGHAEAIHDMKLVIAVIAAFEALRNRPRPCERCEDVTVLQDWYGAEWCSECIYEET